jgi:hypothetical protein
VLPLGEPGRRLEIERRQVLRGTGSQVYRLVTDMSGDTKAMRTGR